VFASPQALLPLPGGVDHAAIAAAMPWLVVGGQGSISRLQQRRLHIIMARLLEQGFVIKQVRWLRSIRCTAAALGIAPVR
jgi:hypothetical protein